MITKNQTSQSKISNRAIEIYAFALQYGQSFSVKELTDRGSYDLHAIRMLVARGLLENLGKVRTAHVYRLNTKATVSATEQCLSSLELVPHKKGCVTYCVPLFAAAHYATSDDLKSYAIGAVTQW